MNESAGASVNRPNVLVILTDELRAQSLGYAGDPNAQTPRIDRLAEESVNYAEAVSGEPICCPARASFLTGQYPLEHGVYINDVPLRPSGPTLAEVFREHGYRTGYIGKWHLYGSPDGVFERREDYIPPADRFGFEYWKALECTHDYNRSPYYAGDGTTKHYWEGYDALAQTRDALSFTQQRSESPYLLMLSLGPPHFPLQTAPEEYRSRFEGAQISLPPNVPEWASEQAMFDLKGYYAHLAAVDDCVGMLLDGIDLANTVVVFSSDHGDMLWSQGLEHKLTAWEESVRVPLLVRAPGREPEVSRQLFNSPDLMPTLLGYAGLPIPGSVSGADLSAPGAGPTSAFLGAPAAYSSLRRSGMEEYRGVRDGRFTYVRTISGPWLLYDNQNDPFQLHNRCDDPLLADVQERFETELQEWLVRLGDEFLPGEDYLRRDGLTHYFEANEPIGFSGTDQWRSTDVRGRWLTIDTALSAVLASSDAREIVADHAPQLLTADDKLLERRSIRLLAMAQPDLVSDAQLGAIDRMLRALGERREHAEHEVALPAWPPRNGLHPRGSAVG